VKDEHLVFMYMVMNILVKFTIYCSYAVNPTILFILTLHVLTTSGHLQVSLFTHMSTKL
jgi:hypothetical protein